MASSVLLCGHRASSTTAYISRLGHCIGRVSKKGVQAQLYYDIVFLWIMPHTCSSGMPQRSSVFQRDGVLSGVPKHYYSHAHRVDTCWSVVIAVETVKRGALCGGTSGAGGFVCSNELSEMS